MEVQYHNKEYHFVVRFHVPTQRYLVDLDTLDVKFGDEIVWDADTQEWEEPNDHTKQDYLDKEEALAEYLSLINTTLRKN